MHAAYLSAAAFIGGKHPSGSLAGREQGKRAGMVDLEFFSEKIVLFRGTILCSCIAWVKRTPH